MTTQAVAPQTDTLSQDLAVFDSLLADVTMAMKPVLTITVSNPESEQKALSAAGQIATLLKRVDAREKELIAPLKARTDSIKEAAKKVRVALDPANDHVRNQLKAYSTEVERLKAENLRLQREKEENERRAAAEKRAREEAALRAEQEAKRKAQEEAAEKERQRIQDELDAKRRLAEKEAADRAAAADLFGGGKAAKELAEKEAAEALKRADEEAASEQKAAEARAAEQAKALADQQERDRIENEVRLQREEDERRAAAEALRKETEAQKVKGSRTDVVVEVIDAWAVPKEFLRDPEVKIADVKKAYKKDPKQIPGLLIREEQNISIRSEAMPAMGALT